MNTKTALEICEDLGAVIQGAISPENLAEMAHAYAEIQAALEAIAEAIKSVVERIVQWCVETYERLRRFQMYTCFPAWVPDRVARALSEHWPRQWLPVLRLGGERC